MPFQTVRGMRDFLPAQMKKKQFIEDFIRRVFEKYGFEPLQTPIVEDFALLAAKGSGGEAIKEEIYYFRDKSERELGLRYDLTVPLGRVAATNQIARPFKRYCIGQVYRYDRPQAKRYREFTQADADIVGAKGAYSDFECLQIAIDVMRGLGFQFKITVNNRKVLEELALKTGIEKGQVKDAFRLIDKLDKIGMKEVKKEFREKKINAAILDFVEANSFEQAKEVVGESESLLELEKTLRLCAENSFSEVAFDVSLARGLEYYTGIVFEIKIEGGPSVGAGGRYDELIALYGGQETPAVGISFGIDRLYDYLEDTLVVGSNSDVLIVPLAEESFPEAFRLSSKIRRLGFGCEVDLMQRNLKKNFEYAEKKGISFMAVLGENEIRAGKFKLKNLGSREEKEFLLSDVSEVSRYIRG